MRTREKKEGSGVGEGEREKGGTRKKPTAR
jgi:hypothetical protein